MTTISPGLYSAGSIVVRGINNGVESEHKIMGSFISPYQARDIRIIRGLESWSIVGTGDMFAQVELLDANSDSFSPPIDTEVNEYGEFELIVDDSVVHAGATYNLRMNKDSIESIVEIPFIEVAQPEAWYHIHEYDSIVYIAINTQTYHTYEYTSDGGITWTDYSNVVLLSRGVYSDGLIQVRAIRDEYVSRPTSLGPIINSYYIYPNSIVPRVIYNEFRVPILSTTEYVFSGRAQPNSLIAALDMDRAEAQIFTVTADRSGNYNYIIAARDLPYKLNHIRYMMTTDQLPERYHDDNIPISQLPCGTVSTYYNGSNRIIVDVFPPTDYDNIAIRRYNGEYTEDDTQLQYELQYETGVEGVYNLYIDGMDYGYITVPQLPVAKYDTVISYQELSDSGLNIRIQMPPGMGYQSVGTIEWDEDLPIRSGIYTSPDGVLVHYPDTDFPYSPSYTFYARASGRNISRSLANTIQVIDVDTIGQELIAGQSIDDDLIIYLTGFPPLGEVRLVRIAITSITSNPSLSDYNTIASVGIPYSTILLPPTTYKLTIDNANLEAIIAWYLSIDGTQPGTYVIDSLYVDILVRVLELDNVIDYSGSTMMNNLNMIIEIPQP